MSEEPVSTKAPSKWLHRKRLMLILAAIMVLICSALFFWHSRQSYSPFPKSIRSKVSFNLYYPSSLDKNLSVDKSSFKLGEDDQAVLFTIVDNKTSEKYYVSIQSYPSDYDFSTFKKKFAESDESVSPVGSIFVGDAASGFIASVRTTDNSWILITTSYQPSNAKIINLAGNFRLVK